MVRMCNDLFSYLPKQNKVLKHGEGDVEAIQESIAKKQDEIFVVGIVDTVIDPRTMMV